MFRLAGLVAAAAASTNSTAAADEAKAKAQVAHIQSTATSVITGSSKVTGFEIPHHAGVAVTYADLAKAGDEYYLECQFAAGATWEAEVAAVAAVAAHGKVAAVAAKAAVPAHCNVDAHHSTAAAEKLAVTADPSLTYEEFFDRLATASGQTKAQNTARDSFVIENGARAATVADATACPVAYDEATFAATATASLGYSWKANDATTAGQWCYSRTFLPHTFSGGLLLTHTAANDTTVAVKVDNTVDRYFDNNALVHMAIGKSK